MCNEVSNLAGKVNPEALNTSLYRPYYAQDFHGRVSASGVRFGMNSMMAAHPSYRVRNGGSCDKSENRRSVQVRILDRGPSSGSRADEVIIDLSRRAAELRFIQEGRTRVRLDVMRWGTRYVKS
jgi:rare lipoprotein A